MPNLKVPGSYFKTFFKLNLLRIKEITSLRAVAFLKSFAEDSKRLTGFVVFFSSIYLIITLNLVNGFCFDPLLQLLLE